jgi:hypothetical protein
MSSLLSSCQKIDVLAEISVQHVIQSVEGFKTTHHFCPDMTIRFSSLGQHIARPLPKIA